MPEFVWQDSYQLNHQLIDDQHELLFELANQMTRSSNKDELAYHTMLLFKHVREHFGTEEQFMRDHQYPNLQQHTENHDLMLVELVSVSEKIQHDEWRQQEVVDFMQQWVKHILDDDSLFNDFIHRQQLDKQAGTKPDKPVF